MLRPVLAGLFAAVLFTACKAEECPPLIVVSDATCSTTQDCIDDGFPTLSCVGGICRRPCLRDRDCVLPALESDDPCITKIEPQKPAVCEDQLCIDGCTGDADCSGGQTCSGGRCVYFAEGFEDLDRDGAVSLDQLMWNTVGKELKNLRTAIAWIGMPGCNLGDTRCAGVAAEGDRFVALEAVPTPEKGTPDVTLTCRSCACCLDCLVNPPRLPALIPSCPIGSTIPIALTCETAMPANCTNVCNDCQQCVSSSVPLGERLLSCEMDAAERTCSSCPSCDAMACETCRTTSCPSCSNLDSEACRSCEAASCSACTPCRACNVCSRALDCELSDPGSAACISNRAACDAQGSDGCYPTPVNYPRAQLTDLEQSLVSPPIDLSAATGPISLQFEYVPFNVGDRYRPGIQGTPASMWPDAAQEIVVQLCPRDCGNEASWSDALLVNGARASFPPATQRGNGLSLGRQSSIDWGSGRLEVDIPEGMRTSELRFRFLPRLDANVQVGVDNILIRSRQ